MFKPHLSWLNHTFPIAKPPVITFKSIFWWFKVKPPLFMFKSSFFMVHSQLFLFFFPVPSPFLTLKPPPFHAQIMFFDGSIPHFHGKAVISSYFFLVRCSFFYGFHPFKGAEAMDVLHEDLLHRLLQSLPGRAWRWLGAATRATRSALRSFLAERNQVKLTQMAFRCTAGDVGDIDVLFPLVCWLIEGLVFPFNNR